MNHLIALSSAQAHQQFEQHQEQEWNNRIRPTAGTAQPVAAYKQELNMNTNVNLNELSFSQLVPTQSNFLKKEDVGEDGVILTIKGFAHDVVKGDNGDEQKVVMHFVEEGYKPMVLNSTNSALLGKITGAATAGEARGKQVVVYDDISVSFGGKVTGGLRLKRVQGAPATPAAPRQAVRTPVDPFDDPSF